MPPFFEWYFDYPPASPGEGTSWSLDTIRPWPADWPLWMGVTLWIVLIVLTLAVSLRITRHLSGFKRTTLLVLRLAILGSIAWCLGEATLGVRRTGLPTVIVLVDSSRSMSLEDPLPSQAKRPVNRERSNGPSTRQRFETARRLLLDPDKSLLQSILDRRRLRVFSFSDESVPLGPREVRSPEDLTAVADAIRNVEPDGAASLPADAIKSVLDEFRGSPPVAIVILTDGVTNPDSAPPVIAAINDARMHEVPIYVVEFGPPDSIADVELIDVLMDEVAIVGTPVRVPGQVRADGFRGKSANVILQDAQTNEIVATTPVQFDGESSTVDFELQFTPESPGEFDYIIRVPILEGETIAENNALTRHVSVREGRLKILLADGQPRYEFRFLKSLLERYQQRTDTIELHTVLQQGDAEYAQQDRSASSLNGQFPLTTDELFTYDVVIFGDLDPELLPVEVLNNLREFVVEQGRAIIFLAGEQFTPVEYLDSPIYDILPIQLKPDDRSPAEVRPFTLQFTAEALRGATAMRGILDKPDDQNGKLPLPTMQWRLDGITLKPGATTLADAIELDTQVTSPVIVLQSVGRGKTILHATDEMWKWKHEADGAFFGPYWLQQIRFLCSARLLGRDSSAELTSDRLMYDTSEAVRLRARFFDSVPAGTADQPVVVQIEQRGGGTRRIELPRSSQSQGLFDATASGLSPGYYHAWIASPEFESVPPSCDFSVEVSDRELLARSSNRQGLKALAERTTGKLYSTESAVELADDLPEGVPLSLEPLGPRPLWDRWESIVLFCLLVTADWGLRQKWRAGN